MLNLVIKIFREALEFPTRDGWTVQGCLSPYTEIRKILLKYQNSIPPTTTLPQTPTTILKVPNPTRLTVILGSYVYRYVSCFRLHGVQFLMIQLGNDQDQTRSNSGSKHLSTSLSNNICFSNMKHHMKILLAESRGSSSFVINKRGVQIWFWTVFVQKVNGGIWVPKINS